jgi:transcription initiation factor TFIIB
VGTPYGSCNFEEIETDEPCCSTPQLIITDDGVKVCHNCGMVYGQEFVEHERRAYTADEVKNRRRTEPRWRNYGPRTVIGISSSDCKGHQLESKKAALFSRLAKIQGSLINSIERNYWESKPKLQSLGTKLHIPDYIMETAWKIYSEVAQQKLTMGRSIDGFVTASLYAAIRIHDFPRLLEEVVEVALLPLRSVHRSLGLVLRLILPKLNMRYKPISPDPLVFRFGNELQLGIGTQKRASDLLKYASKHGMHKMGKDPKGLAAAALYLVSKGSGSVERRTQTQIADIARVTEVTLRTRAKQIKLYLKNSPFDVGVPD